VRRERLPLAGVEFGAVAGLDVDLKPVRRTIKATSAAFALNTVTRQRSGAARKSYSSVSGRGPIVRI
jgi:hypothetical protein